jgi:DNA (cytosine-5)-methyltransferase 1
MTHGSLFSGIGGFDLAASWTGWQNVFQVEIDHFCNQILQKHFPHAKRHDDIRNFNGKAYWGAIDILSGGFPCQPFSLAGSHKGKSDTRYLWPEMLRIIKEVQPTWVLAENVYGLVTLKGGMVLETVCADLESAGFEVQPYLVPACAVGAIHKRERVWVLAYSHRFRQRRNMQKNSLQKTKLSKVFPPQVMPSDQKLLPTPYITGGHDGIPKRLDRIKALGNAIVPQIAYEFFKVVNYIEKGK